MYTPRQITVPIDFSETSRAATRRAVLLAKEFRTPLHLMHAVTHPIESHSLEFGVSPKLQDALREQADEKLRKVAQEVSQQGVTSSCDVFTDDPVTAIRSTVGKYASNLIVMGSHGYTGFKHAFFGSIAERTLRLVACPVLTVRESEAAAGGRIQRILYATDLCEHSKSAGLVASGLAKALGATIDIGHVALPTHDFVDPYGVTPALEYARRSQEHTEKLLERMVRTFADSAAPVHSWVRQGDPARVLVREAERIGADLIVMGTRGATGLAHALLGSVAEKTVRTAHCSVLTVHEPS